MSARLIVLGDRLSQIDVFRIVLDCQPDLSVLGDRLSQVDVS